MKKRNFGFGKVDNFTAEFILCWHSFPVKFEGRHGPMCHAASKKYKYLDKHTLTNTNFKQKATVEKLQG